MRVTLSVTLDRLDGPEQDPHRVVEYLIEHLLTGRSVWVPPSWVEAAVADVDRSTKFDITEVELVNLRD